MSRHNKGFSLVELLVVIAICGLLLSLILPALGRAKKQAQKTVCSSNLRQLMIANEGYATENNGYYVRAAYDIFDLSGYGGSNRWHGVRLAASVTGDSQLNKFDPSKGLLAGYLADGKVKKCPVFAKYESDGKKNAFESGCGGYGYNSIGAGSRAYLLGYCDKAMRSSMKNTEVDRPDRLVMFADTASLQGLAPGQYLIEYSFIEAPKFISLGKKGLVESGEICPTTHFRHISKANVIWADGHVSSPASASWSSKFYRQDVQKRFGLGGFGPQDNSFFKPF